MAYIYRYQLRDKKLRNNTSLIQYTQVIQSVLNDQFYKNLKDNFVEDNYFEFTLYASVSRRVLQDMGRKLKSELPIGIEQYGFVRMEQTLYAIIYSSQDNQQDDIHIEFIDSKILDRPELFMERARLFFEKFSSNDLIAERGYSNITPGIINNYYIDVLDSYEGENYIRNIFDIMDETSCFFVKGYHRRYDDAQFDRKKHSGNIFLLKKCFDAGYAENQEQIIGQEDDKTDYFELYSSQKQNKQIEEIKRKLKLLLNTTENVDALNRIKDNCTRDKRINYKFRVYNVGQAQAISLADNNEPPFLYFDYGMPYGGNSHTRPPQVNILTNPGITIILSHIHKDHWFRIADDFTAYQCNWFIPDQPRTVQLNHVIAEIIVHGGSVNIINSDIEFGRGRLTCGGVSRINPSRCANHVHESGLSLRLEAHDTQGKELNILIAGDQRYDYINASQLSNLDLLVASHHGGDCCWSNQGRIPEARALSSSTVIYSYGTNNTHGHPSNESAYIAANWAQAYHTTSGDYDIAIFL